VARADPSNLINRIWYDSSEQEIEWNAPDPDARRSGERQRRRAQISQFAQHKLTLELEGDHEEEKCRQPVVDPMPQRTGEVQ
jgi:hypothetical protein